MGKSFLKIIIMIRFKFLLQSCVFFFSGMVSGSIKSDLGGFWFLLFSFYISFP